MSWEIRQGDALALLREMPDASVRCCVTSPPYWSHRVYGSSSEIGGEATPSEYVERLSGVLMEARRVLTKDTHAPGCAFARGPQGELFA